MATMMESATKTIRDHAEPALEALEENVRNVRQAVVAGRRTLEDYSDEATHQVRRHPFMAVGLAGVVGTLFGCVLGYTLRRHG
jgi:ElaB/YqjD/DUF883 family membrane-anchored ribosome-binding protein